MNGVFGRQVEMRALYEEALTVDPLTMSVLGNLAGANLNVNLDRTDELIERMREIEPNSYSAEIFTAWSALFRGDAEIALDRFRQVGGPNGLWGQSLALWDLGRDAESDAAIQEMARVDAGPTKIALSYAYRGDSERAFEWLDRAYEERDYELIEMRMFAPFENIDTDPRWEALLSRLGISDADAREIF
jgi:tetratricopeptide (TPR) repeat protein